MFSVSARDACVEFPIYDAYARSLRHHFVRSTFANRGSADDHSVGGTIGASRSGRVVIRALSDLNFECKQGDRVGLLGRNGSGKTTLLRAITGIYEPARGSIEVRGNVTPLFDMSIGMDPDSTGIENIWLRGRLIGLTDETIAANVEEIAEFSELGDYLYMPIRTYSAGMLVRLAFAVSTAVTPEILLLDEMIGAGDAGFMERAQMRLKRFIEQTGILVIASHSAEILRLWCNKGLLLDKGRMIAFAPIEETIERFHALVAHENSPPTVASPGESTASAG